MRFRQAALYVLCLAFFCLQAPEAFALTLAEVDGVWHLDVGTTLQKSTDAELKEAVSSRKDDFAGFTLTVDAKTHTLTMAMPGEKPDILGFVVAREEGKAIVLTTEDSSEIHLEVTGKNTLMMGVVIEEGKGVESDIYFKR